MAETEIQDEVSNENQETRQEDNDAGMRQMDARDELRMLKQRADMMGVPYSPNIGVETLRERINNKIGSQETAVGPVPPVPPAPDSPAAATDLDNPIIAALMQQMAAMQAQINNQSHTRAPFDMPENGLTVEKQHSNRLVGGGIMIPREIREAVIKEQMRLIRIRITCLDPKKKDLPGEIITIANEAIGTVRKFVPYGDQTENGYHVPYCIYTFLNEKKFLNIRTKQDPKSRTPIVESGMVREYSIETLAPLTENELQELARQQLGSDAIDKESVMS